MKVHIVYRTPARGSLDDNPRPVLAFPTRAKARAYCAKRNLSPYAARGRGCHWYFESVKLAEQLPTA